MSSPDDPHGKPSAADTGDLAGVVRVLGAYACAALIGAVLAGTAQPQRPDLLFAGILLFTVGLGVGRYALEIIVLPFAVVAWLLRRLAGRPRSASHDSRGEALARWVFVLTYTLMSAVGGGVISAFAGGWGMFTGVVAFGFAGMVYGVLVRNVVLHHLDSVESMVTVPAQQGAEDAPPEVVTRIAKRVVDELTRK